MRSLLTADMDKCYYCGKPKKIIHAIYGTNGQHERASIEDGMVIPICWECNVRLHISKHKQRQLHIEGQIAWERHYPMLVFEKRYGRTFL